MHYTERLILTVVLIVTSCMRKKCKHGRCLSDTVKQGRIICLNYVGVRFSSAVFGVVAFNSS